MKPTVYIASIEQLNDSALYEALYSACSEMRKKRTDAYLRQNDKMLSVCAEALLRHAVKKNGFDFGEIVTGEHGKPYFKCGMMHFNLSHSHGYAMCAVSDNEIGCDIEKVTDLNLPLAKRFFAPDEYNALIGLNTEAERTDMFFRLWTLKESFIKAVGLGMSLPLDSFCITAAKTVKVTQTANKNEYFFAESDLVSGCKCAVCSAFPLDGISFELISPAEIL